MKLLSQQTIRDNHLKHIYALIHKTPDISRVGLAALTKLSKTTVSSLVDELIAGNYITDLGEAQSLRQGRKPNLLTINGCDNFVAVMNWYKNRLEAVLVSADSHMIFREEVPLKEGEDAVLSMADVFRRVLLPRAGGARIMGICVVVPGMVDAERQQIISTVLPLQKGDRVVDRLRGAIPGYPLAILNDTACYAYAENIFTGIHEPYYAYINLSRGVGACLFANGKMLRGAGAMATQFGHYSIDRSGPMCGCGNRGCLERLVGEARLGERAVACGADAFMDPSDARFSRVGDATNAGDEKARKLVSLLAADLAYGISNLISVFNPQLVVIGGSGVRLGNYFLQDIRKNLQACGFQEFVSRVEVRYSRLGEDALSRGAAQYYIDQHYDFSGDMRENLILS